MKKVKRAGKQVMGLFLSAAMVVSSVSPTVLAAEESRIPLVKAGSSRFNQLVWSDEFDGTELNRNNWEYELGNQNDGWGNKEKQYYTNRKENLSVGDGMLTITAKKENYEGYEYTSARINTLNLHTFKYGRIEARIKMDNQQGNWPAFWMLGDNIYDGTGWPQCGEIDIMEWANKWKATEGTLHWADSAGNHAYNSRKTESNAALANLDVTQWHEYAIEWDEDAIAFLCDGVEYNRIGITDPVYSEFHNEFFILLNMAVGGNYTGNNIDANFREAHMYVDYVRVYQEDESNGGGTSDAQIASGVSYNPDTQKLTFTASDIAADSQMVKAQFGTFATEDAARNRAEKSKTGEEMPACDLQYDSKNQCWTTTLNYGLDMNAYFLYNFYIVDKNGASRCTDWNPIQKVSAYAPAKTVSVTGVTVNPASTVVQVGKSVDLAAIVAPEDATDKSVTWKSENEAVATVDANGKVTTKTTGDANIVVTTVDGNHKANCKVTVTDEDPDSIAVESIKLNKSVMSLPVGKTETLIPTFEPSIVGNRNVTWISENPDVAFVKDGVVTAKAIGTTVITAKAEGGDNVTATCEVTVTEKGYERENCGVEINKDGKIVLYVTNMPDEAEIIAYSNVFDDEESANAVKVVDERLGGRYMTKKNGIHELVLDTEVNADKYLVYTFNKGDVLTPQVIAIKDIPMNDNVSVEGITLDKDILVLAPEASEDLVAKIAPADATNQNIIWHSENESIATVTDGKVTAVAEGKTHVTATTEDGNFVATCIVRVGEAVSVTGITLEPTTLDLKTTETANLVATIAPQDADNQKITWSTSDEKIAGVDQNGVVTARRAGTATITVTTADGGHTASCTVNVTEVPYERDARGVEIKDGKVVIYYTGATSDNLDNNGKMWTYVNVCNTKEEAESVTFNRLNGFEMTETDEPGVYEFVVNEITGNQYLVYAFGSAELQTPVVTQVYDIQENKISVTDVTIEQNSLEIEEKRTGQLTAKVEPENATYQNVTWKSADETIATVDSQGVVTGVKAGTTTITAIADGAKTASIEVTVKAVPVTGISVNEKLTVIEGGTGTIKATITPDNASNQEVEWTIDKPEFATVDAAGRVTGLKEGNATVTATTKDGGFTASCVVTIEKPVIVTFDAAGGEEVKSQAIQAGTKAKNPGEPEREGYRFLGWFAGETEYNFDEPVNENITLTAKWEEIKVNAITLSKKDVELIVGDSLTVEATVKPETALNKTVVWTSSDPDKVKVVDGVITAIAEGEETITAAIGEVKAEISVKVIAKTVTVTFDSDGGDITPNEQTVKVGETADKPTTPKKDGYIFLGWYLGDEEFKFVDTETDKATPVTEDITLVAKWAPEVEYTVTFDSAGGSSVEPQITVAGELESLPIPTRKGYRFMGWYLDEKQYNSGDEVTSDITLTAKWEAIKVTKITGLPTSTLKLSEGESVELTATVEPANALNTTVIWTSSDENKVIVNKDGKVTAVEATTEPVTITAAVGSDVKAEVKVEVISDTEEPEIVPVESVTLDKTTLTLEVGQTDSLKATVLPEKADDKTVEWKSTKPEFATVDKQGNVTAVAVGQTTITVITNDGVKTAECVVTVTPKVVVQDTNNTPDTPVVLADYTVTFDAAGGSAVSAQVVKEGAKATQPANPTKAGYTFAGWYNGAAAYDFNAVVTGNMTLTAKWDAIKVNSIKLTGMSKQIAVNKKIQLTATVAPTDAADQTLKWSVSNDQYASVTQDGMVTVKKAGKGKSVTVTAEAADGSGIKATYKIKIMPYAVKKISLKASKSSVTAGSKVTVKATVSPFVSKTKMNKTLQWSSSNTEFATVNQKGVVTTKKAGKGKSVKITAKATDGSNKKKTITIKIK